MTTARRALWPLALVVATLAAYLQVRGHEFLGWDDPGYVIANPVLRLGLGWEGLRRIFGEPYMLNWIPLTSLSLQIDYRLYGLSPAGYLLTNVALHTLSSLILYAAFARMTGARGRSAFVAAVFALHPLHVESVAWVSERKDCSRACSSCSPSPRTPATPEDPRRRASPRSSSPMPSACSPSRCSSRPPSCCCCSTSGLSAG
jgi:hypothetical protein